MSRLEWGTPSLRLYETGVEQGVLYVAGRPGVPWNGLISVDENPSGAEERAYYIDGVKYLNLLTDEEFVASITAFTYPDEFSECDGSYSVFPGLIATRQYRKPFGLTYKVKVGNDVDGLEHGYKIHLVYNALAKPAGRSNHTIDESTNPATFTWDITTTPTAVSGYKHTAHFIIDSRQAYPQALSTLEDALYGSDANAPYLPTLAQLLDMFAANSNFTLVDHGDGTWTADGPDEYIEMTDSTTFAITWPEAVYLDAETYTISTP